jgi:PTH1 family peptidyl-tRNA hydrolase
VSEAEPPRVVLGLGNPGPEYAGTRHNVGARVVERLARELGAALRRDERVSGLATTAEVAVGGRSVLLARSRTWMNRSGSCALRLCRVAGIEPAGLVVVFDDADLELGRVRVRPSGGAGGHNGVRSIIDALAASEFSRVRLGVCGAGREQSDLADYVLEPFDDDERPLVEQLVSLGAEATLTVVTQGTAAAMAVWNGRRADSPDPAAR